MDRLYSLRALLLISTLTACLDPSAEQPSDEAESTQEDLRVGSSGPEVEDLHQFLRNAGYLPNEALSEDDPEWRPMVAMTPSAADEFDEATELAVKVVQQQGGLEPTGVVDAATQDLMDHRFCGTPEHGAAPSQRAPGEPIRKYALGASRRTKSFLTWKIDNLSSCPASLKVNNDCTAYAYQQITTALNDWRNISGLSFASQEGSGSTDLVFHFQALSSKALAMAPVGGSQITINTTPTNFTWARNDALRYAARHEIGHAVGLRHSSVPPCTSPARRCSGSPYNPVMFWSGPAQNSFTEDDLVALNALYPKWEQVPGCARDIASIGTDTWAIGCNPAPGGHEILRWNGSGWTVIPGGAERIAVGARGAIWAVNEQNRIYVTSFQNGSYPWTEISGCAQDVAVTVEGWPVVVGCDEQPGGYGIHQLFCAVNGCSWQQIPGGATSVAIGKDNQLWATNNANLIYRRRPDLSWEELPGRAFDVAVNLSGSPWAVGVDNALWSFAEQSTIAGLPAGSETPAQFTWYQAPGRSGSRVAADNQYVWLAGSSIYRIKIRL